MIPHNSDPPNRPNLIVICGTTASGKTRLGTAIAGRLHGEIISVDSRQVYRGMDIGTGKDLGEYGAVPCHLIDIADPARVYTVWDYQRDFYRTFRDIRARGRMPVAVGGSGLYLEAVLRKYRIPDVPEDAALRTDCMALDKEELDARLRSLDPVRHETTDRSSKKRIVRAIEVATHAADMPDPAPADLPPDIRPLVIGVRWPRPVLHERIRVRLLARMDGLIEETRRLIDAGVPKQRVAMFGLEYKHAARLLRGETDRERMFGELFTAIRHFAKRQETYFRGMERRGVPVCWIAGDDFEKAMDLVDAAMSRESPDDTGPR